MDFRKAEAGDAQALIELRIDFLRDDKGILTPEEEAKLREQMETYFTRHLRRDFIAVIAEDRGKAVSSAFLAISEKPANLSFITGKTGTLLNVYTYPEYRRRGLATRIVGMIIEEAKRLGVSQLDLNATAEGRPLYERLGFRETDSKYTPMRLRLL